MQRGAIKYLENIKGKFRKKFTSENLWDKKTLPQEW